MPNFYKLILIGLLLAGYPYHACAQVSLQIGNGTNISVSGSSNVVVGGGSFVNNGTFTDAGGTLKATGATSFSGTGATNLNKLIIDQVTGTTAFNNVVTVSQSATFVAGNVNVGAELLYLRSDQNPNATLITNSSLTGTVKGLLTKATVITGTTSYTSLLSTNISGNNLLYQWQSSPDNSTWTDVASATAATYTASVSTSTYYRVKLSSSQSAYSQNTPSIKLDFQVPGPVISGFAPTSGTTCIGSVTTFTATLANVTEGYSFTLTNANATSLTGTSTSSTFSQTAVAAGSGVQTFSLTVSTASGSSVASATVSVGSHPDLMALTDLYNSTNGAGWTNKTKWLTNCDPCSGWQGIGCSGGRVTSIFLNSNNLSGSLPASLSALTNLTTLSLSSNQLTGSLPASLSVLTNLTTLSLGYNRLAGSIPEELGALIKLTSFGITNNQLTGSLPSSFSALTDLTSLDVSLNQLSGPIPAGLGNLWRLIYLRLNTNQFTGSIPASMGNLSSLQSMNMSANQLSGSIPASFSGLSGLKELVLSFNQLTGGIPESLSTLTGLDVLNLAFNPLGGSLPASLSALTNLTYLYLSNNQLSGPIPAGLSKLTKLNYLNLGTNNLSGCYPSSLTALCAVSTKNFTSNAGLPGGGSAVAFTRFCSTGQGGDAFSPTATASFSAVCTGETVQLSTTGGTSFTWVAPAGATLTSAVNSSTASASLTLAGSQTFTVIVGQGGSCTQTATVSVLGNAAPPLSLTASGPLSCSISNVTLTASEGYSQYVFSAAATQQSGTGGNTALASTAGVYSVTATNASGCSSTATVMVSYQNCNPIVLNPISPQSATASQAFSLTIADNVFTDGETPGNLTLSVSGLPAGLSFTAPATISGTPSTTLTTPLLSSVTVTATDTGGLSISTTFPLTVYPAFSIIGVTLSGCTVVAPNRRAVQLTPIYVGLNGQPIRFSIENEFIPTYSSGPYRLELNVDSPIIVLKAMQQDHPGEASFTYNWVAACSGSSTPPTVVTSISPQSVTVNQPFSFTLPANTFTDAETPSSLSLLATNLPTGTRFTAPARISGAFSTTTGTPFTITVRAYDPGGLSVSTTFQLSVIPSTLPCPSMHSVKAGNWNDASVWSCGRVPLSQDLATLNHAVTIPPNYTGQAFRVLYGTGGRLLFSATGRLRITEN
ncbi:hypothetical protein GCM10028807_15090 [Spirosoma daeguense]